MNPQAVDLVVDGLAAYRLTRLVTTDRITGPAREYVTAAALDPDDYAPTWLAELIDCRWCTAVWVGAGVVAARRLAPRAWRPVGTALALAAVGALLARLEETPEPS